MNYARVGLAALAGTVASFAVGGLLFWLLPGLMDEARKYPALFRPKEEMFGLMPIGLLASFVSILVATFLFAMTHQGGSGLVRGAHFGVLLGLFVVCGFVLHNYVNLNMGLKLALVQAGAYFIQWLVVGTVIGLVYRPHGAP